jgi:LacI family transcriptional regulator
MDNPRVTAKDVAVQAGVSSTTVSYVLNNVTAANISEKTRQCVLAAAKKLGYVPDAAAQALASGRTQTIGLILPRTQQHPLTNSTHFRIVEGLLEVAQQSGVQILIDTVRETHNADTYLNLARNKRIDGLILSDLRVDDEALPKLLSNPFPTVLLGRLSGGKLSSVEFDNRSGARLAVDHLVSQGHKRIGLIAHAPAAFTGATERINGYRDSLTAHKLSFDETLVRYGDYSPESGHAAALSLLETPPLPTALFVTSDQVALGVLAALHQRGVTVPDDMAVVGFDDSPIAKFTIPSLTTVRLPFEEMGRQAGRMLLELIFHKAKPGREKLLETELCVRDSSVRHKPISKRRSEKAS